ncbi:hypothetical protein GALMADRAFT_145843 [Galerina marginata CBS 339.88]|uniref:Uncharacterized protein n=1 Tax=Galerina marginata (strain CBS 339.88) TaxID=685588 RepID=A0A067SQS3_GALM3|nr:hypothetical protein GALMADRAFT_145843 [Galerina marginata CBS 339.88]
MASRLSKGNPAPRDCSILHTTSFSPQTNSNQFSFIQHQQMTLETGRHFKTLQKLAVIVLLASYRCHNHVVIDSQLQVDGEFNPSFYPQSKSKMFKLSVAVAFVAFALHGVISSPLPLEGGVDLVARVPQTQTLTGLVDSIVGETEGLVAAVLGETPPEIPGRTSRAIGSVVEEMGSSFVYSNSLDGVVLHI